MGKITTVSKLLRLCLPVGLILLIGSTALGKQAATADSGRPQVSTTAEDIPEEVLQIQIGLEANSSLTGKFQGAEAHTQEQQELRVGAAEVPPKLSPSIYRAVELLRLRKVLKSLLPFF
jgi:hypothetical protein